MSTCPFIDLASQQARIGDEIQASIARVLSHGQYIFGPEVSEFEEALGDFVGAGHVVSCANGTDALTLILMAETIGPGDLVFVPAFTFVATAEAVAQLGATPVFVDVDERSFNICPASLRAAIDEAREKGLGRPAAIVAVDLFGQPADYRALRMIADDVGLCLIGDAAQSLGGALDNRRVGTLADYTSTSFFPAKPLGCYGDGGAVLTDDGEKAELLRSLRMHGKGAHKYDTARVGLNSRLDTIQAAILIQKLAIFSDELDRRQDVAARYNKRLDGLCKTPEIKDGAYSSWALYTVRSTERDRIAADLGDSKIPTAIYYPKPLHRMGGYDHFPVVSSGVPVAERLCETVLSLPMHPYLDGDTQERIADAVCKSVASAKADEMGHVVDGLR